VKSIYAYCCIIACLVPIRNPFETPSEGPTVTQAPPTVDLDYRLKLNISVELVNDSSILVTWKKEQRREGFNFCRNKYKWQLEVLTWHYSEFLNLNDFEHIWNQSFINDTAKVQSSFEISTTDCMKNRTYLDINVSNSSYYKFQLRVRNSKDIVKGSNYSGSYLHYFGSQSQLD